MDHEIEQKSVRNLLDGSTRYVVPMYQRNYVWEEREIIQLVQDIIDNVPLHGNIPQNYYIGTLVVWKSSMEEKFEVIDGQQRFTTLVLLLLYLKKCAESQECANFSWFSFMPLSFASREFSNLSLQHLFDGKFKEDPRVSLQREDHQNTAILDGYRILQKVVPQKFREYRVSAAQFAEYFCQSVVIMQVQVPPDTDLNHYFEIMNNRGEQLEKHEVLKARMLDILNGILDSEQKVLAQNTLQRVWEACANMEKYVQSGFTPAQRHVIFGKNEWSSLVPENFDSLSQKLGNNNSSMSTQSLDEIISLSAVNTGKDPDEGETPERFHSVINFQNFLLHVLRVSLQMDIPLDDKRLLSTFEEYVLNVSDSIFQVQAFTYALLRCKYLFDYYVLKREFLKGEDSWSLKRYQRSKESDNAYYSNTFGEDEATCGDNRRVLMLQASLHVSTPTLVYKHWLNAVLYWLYWTPKVELPRYLDYLESIAKAFVFDRFLAPQPADYFQIIYKRKGQCQNKKQNYANDFWKEKLRYDNIENNLVFNYLDYLLWLKGQKSPDTKFREKVAKFEFTFRSSVEHYYPQHPLPGLSILAAEVLNSFGNLCLISPSKNSRLSNLTPKGKNEYYTANEMNSIKQYLMMQVEVWNENAICDHEFNMLEVLLGSLDG